MDCPNCGKEMTIENVETSSAHQGLVGGVVDIIGPDSEDMNWCEPCQLAEPIEHDRGDESDGRDE